MEIKNHTNIIPLILIGTAGMLIMVVFIIILIIHHYRKMTAQNAIVSKMESAHQNELLNASMDIAEQERVKIAANIHDEIGMMLHVVKQNINKVKRNLGDAKLRVELLDETDKAVEEMIATTRIIAYELAPPPLINIGFIEGMFYLCDQFNSTKIIEVEIKTNLEHIEMDKKNSVHLYRLVKEVLNNIVKHAKAQNVQIEININSNLKVLTLVIGHNGIGITNEAIKRLAQSSRGIGLRSIIGRAQLIMATVQYVMVDENSSKIIIEIPI